MSKEGIIDIYDGTQLAEPQLNSQSILLGLIAGGQEKEEILQKIVFYLESNSYIQASFLKTLFQSLGEEDGPEITNRRDAALEILTQKTNHDIALNKVIVPFVKQNIEIVYVAYKEALRHQTSENDPFSGSIFALLEAGKAIAPLLKLDKQKRRVIITTWKRVARGFHEGNDLSHIRSEIRNIQSILYRDNEVAELKNKHYIESRIKQILGMTTHEVSNSSRRLNEDKKIEKSNRGRKNSPRNNS